MSAPSPLTGHQWQKVLKATAFAFLSTFLSTFVAGGGIQTTWDATFVLVASSVIAAANAALYSLWLVFEEDK